MTTTMILVMVVVPVLVLLAVAVAGAVPFVAHDAVLVAEPLVLGIRDC